MLKAIWRSCFRGGARKNPQPAPATGPEAQPAAVLPRLLVAAATYRSALELAPRIESAGFVAIFRAARDFAHPALLPAADAVLILREVAPNSKLAACRELDRAPEYRNLPRVVVATLLERGLAFPADVVVQPPGSLQDALNHIHRLLGEIGAESDAGVAAALRPAPPLHSEPLPTSA